VPSPDYSDFIGELDRSGFRKSMPLTLYFESSRGCWWGAKHHCTFCGLNGATMAFRRRSANKVYDEIVRLSKEHRCFQFCATDNILANEYFTELLPRLADLDCDLSFFYEVKANLRRDQLELMRSAGIIRIQPGIESFSSRVLQMMRKGITAIQNIQLIKWCYELDVDPGYNVLYGFPGETADDYKELPDVCRQLAHLRPPNNLSRVLFERFSPYFFDRDRFKLYIEPWTEYQYLYPKGRVDLAKIAYFFGGGWEGQTGNPDDYMGPSRSAWESWRKQWERGDIFCYYEKGPRYLRIVDNRPRISSAPLRTRTTYLNERHAAIYLFCDEHRSFRSVVRMVQERFGSDISEHTIRSWLDQLVFQWLLFQEDDRYLALAVRKPQRRRIPRRPYSITKLAEKETGDMALIG
jgi:ribosomal peptide maturation radical SAM protein 1